jgi:hypothetical protein
VEGLVCWGAAVLMVATPSIAAVVNATDPVALEAWKRARHEVGGREL